VQRRIRVGGATHRLVGKDGQRAVASVLPFGFRSSKRLVCKTVGLRRRVGLEGRIRGPAVIPGPETEGDDLVRVGLCRDTVSALGNRCLAARVARMGEVE
jgi:hypothetical protein